MTVRLNRMYEIAKGHGIRLVAGRDGLKKRVKWFRLMENDDVIEYLEDGLLLFTTGVAIKNENELIDLVKKQHMKKSSGTVLHVGKNIERVPDELIDYCNENDYPLFSVPWENNLPMMMKDFSKFFVERENLNKDLERALTDAIAFPDMEEAYMPVFDRYGFSEDDTYCIVLVDFSKELERSKNDKTKLTGKEIKKVLVSLGTNSIVTEGDNSFIILFPSYSMNSINQIASRILKVLSETGRECIVGISKNVKGLSRIAEIYLQAMWCVKISNQKRLKNCTVNFEDIGIYKLLSLVGDKKELKKYYTETMGKLEEYDRQKGTNFKEVLRLYINSNRSEKKVAEALYMHRNTVNYKLAKIQKILECDLSQVDVFVKIYLAMCIENLLM